MVNITPLVAVAIVVQADLQWAYDLLDIVVVRPETAIVYVPCQLGNVRESIDHCLCHWGFLGIYPDLGIKPSLEVLDYEIRLLLLFLLAIFNAEAGNICIVLNGVQPVNGCNRELRPPPGRRWSIVDNGSSSQASLWSGLSQTARKVRWHQSELYRCMT